MGAGMSRGRTPHKPRAAAVTPDDHDLDPEAAGAGKQAQLRKKDEQKNPSTITPVAVVDVLKTPEVEEAKSVIYAQGESQTVKMTSGTRTAKKGPYLIAAEMEASMARAKVEHLRLAAIKMKYEGVKPIEKLTKVDKWASDASDRRILSEYLDALDEAAVAMHGDPCAFVPRPHLRRFRINPPLNVSPAHLSERKQLVKPGG